MSASGSLNDEGNNATTLGRGRGRGIRNEVEIGESAASTGSTRSVNNEQAVAVPSGNGNGNAKRGLMRDQKQLAFYKTRPETSENSKEGKSGKQITMSANYFKILRKPDFQFTLYRVDFEPEIELDVLRKVFLAKHRQEIGGYLFDGVNMLYLTQKLPQDKMQFDCESREGSKYVMTIKTTETVILPTNAMALQTLNVLLRRTMEGLHLQLVGRNLYDPKSKVKLNEYRIELWPGYITSIRQHEKDILVCTEISHKVMRQDTIYDIMRESKRAGGRDWQTSFKKEIVGSIVLTDYNNNTYRVDDVDFNKSPKDTFQKRNGESIAYKTYYEDKYKLIIKDENQPMLISNAKARDIRAGREQVLVLVPELCKATGLTDQNRANFTMMRGLANHTQMDPTRRKNRLLEFSRSLHNSKESMAQLTAFKTSIDQNIIEFPGRQLNQESMLFGRGAIVPNSEKADWTNALRSNAMYTAVDLQRWVYMFPQKLAREAEEFLQQMKSVSAGMYYTINEPRKITLPDDRTANYISEIENIVAKDPKMIVIIVPNIAADRYSAIKRITCVNRAIPTQVIVGKTIIPKKGGTAGLMSIATKVMIQINTKLGGAPWMIKFPMAGTMTIGYDVTHDTKDKSRSFGAFVASMDLKEHVRYFSSVTAHKQGDEVAVSIEHSMVQALKAYNALHKALPDRIFFYRDGVGDGQIEYVHQNEVSRLQKKLEDIYKKNSEGKMPKFSFIIVNKRLNTRIFVNKGKNVDNPPSGCVVDSTITLPERYDFFLVSQSVRQGTVAPTSYNIIHDTNGLSPDQMQIITYKQTHLYYNWSGTTRVPAVVQYAHKLAFLVGNFLHQSPSTSFDNQLYFL